jgi:hypothetical protein
VERQRRGRVPEDRHATNDDSSYSAPSVTNNEPALVAMALH